MLPSESVFQAVGWFLFVSAVMHDQARAWGGRGLQQDFFYELKLSLWLYSLYDCYPVCVVRSMVDRPAQRCCPFQAKP